MYHVITAVSRLIFFLIAYADYQRSCPLWVLLDNLDSEAEKGSGIFFVCLCFPGRYGAGLEFTTRKRFEILCRHLLCLLDGRILLVRGLSPQQRDEMSIVERPVGGVVVQRVGQFDHLDPNVQHISSVGFPFAETSRFDHVGKSRGDELSHDHVCPCCLRLCLHSSTVSCCHAHQQTISQAFSRAKNPSLAVSYLCHDAMGAFTLVPDRSLT